MWPISKNCLECLKKNKEITRCEECQEECPNACMEGHCSCFASCESDYSEGSWDDNIYWDDSYHPEDFVDSNGVKHHFCVTVPDYANNPAFQFKEGERVGQCPSCKNSIQFCLCSLPIT